MHKRFLGVQALQGVDLRLFAGEVHALMGQNGAGVHQADLGEMRLAGQTIAPETPLDAQRLGISTVYQEVNLCPNLSVAENIYAGRYPRRGAAGAWRIDRPRMHAQASEQQRLAGGYDHSFLLDAACRDGSVPAAELLSADGHLAARLYTDRPAVQFYSGQSLATSQRRGGGGGYGACHGLALEPGVPPDSPNHPEWAPWSDCLAEPGTTWRAWMRWEFEVR